MDSMNQSAFEFVRENVAQTPFHHWLLPQVLAVDEQAGSVTINLPVRPEFYRLPGRPEIHGAIVAAIVDISGHAAIAAKVLHSVATVDMRVDYLRLAGGAELRAVATVVKLGRTIGVVDVHVTDDQNRLVAIGRAAYVIKNV
jgi:uncharacterized protein (TIGR00369 family)